VLSSVGFRYLLWRLVRHIDPLRSSDIWHFPLGSCPTARDLLESIIAVFTNELSSAANLLMSSTGSGAVVEILQYIAGFEFVTFHARWQFFLDQAASLDLASGSQDTASSVFISKPASFAWVLGPHAGLAVCPATSQVYRRRGGIH
jgi:hypothetical protein